MSRLSRDVAPGNHHSKTSVNSSTKIKTAKRKSKNPNQLATDKPARSSKSNADYRSEFDTIKEELSKQKSAGNFSFLSTMDSNVKSHLSLQDFDKQSRQNYNSETKVWSRQISMNGSETSRLTGITSTHGDYQKASNYCERQKLNAWRRYSTQINDYCERREMQTQRVREKCLKIQY